MKKTPKIIVQSLVRSLEINEVAVLNALISELDDFYETAKYAHFFKLLKGPLMNLNEKRAILNTVLNSFSVGMEAQALLTLLIQKNQMADLPRVISSLREFRVKKFNVDEAEVITAKPLTDAQRERAKIILKKISGGEVLIHEKIHPAILGGLVIKLRDSLLDASLLRKIKEIRKYLAV